MKNQIAKFIAEFLGTLAIVLFGCGRVAVATDMNQPALMPFVPLVFGLAVGVMIYATGHISGAHFNPAVSFAFASIKEITWKDFSFYCLAQVLGSIVGCVFLWVLIPDISTYAATKTSIPLHNAFLAEMLFTFFLMFVISAIATDARAAASMSGAAIGATVALNAFQGASLTGASMNPARSIGPAFFEGDLSQLWLYILAPIFGATLAAKTYRLIR